jgi:phosphoglycerol transferase MdoB-like AlkP superfamily enzyme
MLQRYFQATGHAGLVAASAIGISAIVRLLLWLATTPAHEGGVLAAITIIVIGLMYDSIVALLILAPLLVLRLLWPGRWLNGIAAKVTGAIVLFCGLYALLFTAVAEWLFWDEFGSRFNFIAVDYLVYRQEVTSNISESYPLQWILPAIGLGALVLTFLWLWPLRSQQVLVRWRDRAAIASLASVLAIMASLSVGDVWHHVSDNRYQQELSANGIYQFFYAFNNNQLDFPTFYATEDDHVAGDILASEYGVSMAAANRYDIHRHVASDAPEKHLNVVLVVVESLSAKYLGAYGNTKGLTPNLDHLAQQSLVFDQLYATGTRTVRGLEAITLSIPPTPGHSIVKRQHNENLYNISTEFNNRNYAVNFFYGGYGYFDNMNYFFGNNGFNVVDRTDFTDNEVHFANAWGVADEDVFSKAINYANDAYQKKQPFFHFIMTTSNHRPFTYPGNRVAIPSGDGREGAVQYTDYAIGKLIEDAKQQPWFDDTVFIVIADHCAGVAGKTALPVADYHIPMLIYSPAHIQPRHVDTLVSQIDLAPTLLSLLDFSYDSEFFGRDALGETAEKKPRALIANYQSLGLFENNILTVLEPRKVQYQIIDPLNVDKVGTISQPQLLKQTIALYQSADYVFRNGLSRVRGNKPAVASHSATTDAATASPISTNNKDG